MSKSQVNLPKLQNEISALVSDNNLIGLKKRIAPFKEEGRELLSMLSYHLQPYVFFNSSTKNKIMIKACNALIHSVILFIIFFLGFDTFIQKTNSLAKHRKLNRLNCPIHRYIFSTLLLIMTRSNAFYLFLINHFPKIQKL